MKPKCISCNRKGEYNFIYSFLLEPLTITINIPTCNLCFEFVKKSCYDLIKKIKREELEQKYIR